MTQDFAKSTPSDAALQDSEAKLRLALESGRMGTWDWDLTTGAEIWSLEQSRLFGREPNQASNDVYDAEAFFKQVHPDDLARIQTRAEQAASAGLNYVEDEFRIIRPDGSVIWIASHTRLHRDPQDNVVRMSGVNMDVTERKQTETALRASESQLQKANTRFRIAEEASRSFVYEWTIETGAEERSEGFTKVLGYTHAEHPNGGAAWEALMHPDDVLRVRATTEAMLTAGESSAHSDYRLRHKNGAWVWVFDDYTVVRDEQGHVRRVVGSIVDITERKRVEERLHRLQTVTASFAEAQTLEEVRRIILSQVLRALGADGGGLRRVTETGLTLDEHDLGSRISEETVRNFSDVPLQAQHPAAEAVRNAQAVFHRNAQESIQRYPHLAEAITRQKTEANAHLPLRQGEKVFGVLSLDFSEAHTWDEAERAFAMALADRAAVAYERARLFEVERETRERTERLQALTARLATALTPADGVKAVLEEGLPALGSNAGSVVQLQGQELEIVGAIGYAEDVVRPWQRFPLTAPAPLADAARTGQSIWVGSPEDFQQAYGRLPDSAVLAMAQSWVALPLLVDKRVLGALGFSYPERRNFDADTRHFAETLADLCAQALERTRLYDVVRTSEKRFHQLANAMPQIVWSVDATLGRASYLNQQWLDYTGLTLDESLRDPNSPIHSEDRAVAEAMWAENLAHGNPFEYELRLRRHDGVYRWHLARCVPVRDGFGNITGWHGTSTDIDARKRAEMDARFLADLGQHFTRIVDPADLIKTITRALGEHFGTSRCVFSEVKLEQGSLIIQNDYFQAGLLSAAGEHRLSSTISEDIVDYRAGRIVIRNDTRTDLRTADRYKTIYEPIGVRATLGVPLLRAGQWVAAMSLVDSQPRQWTNAEVELLRTVAERTWLAIENARLQAETQALNATLEARVTERTHDLRESQAQLRALSTHAERVRESERARIAREVHDELGGSLTGLKMSLSRTVKNHEADTELMAKIQDMRNQIDGLVQTVRRIASDLRPPLLDHFGLFAALEWQAHEWEQRTGIACAVTLPSEDVKLSSERSTAVFRVFQESLTNVARHSQATQVTATVKLEGGQLVLTVKDNGRGISAEALRPGKSLGLLGMRERMLEVSGDLDIRGALGEGTTVTIRVALD